MATSSFNQALTGNGTINGTLTVADSSGFEVGATVFLLAEGQDVKRLKIQSKPDSTSVVVVNLDNSTFNASGFTTSANAKLFQPKSSLVFTSGSDTAPFYPKIDSLNKTTAITAPEESELVLDADVGNSLVVRKSGIEMAAIDSDGVIRHGGAVDSKLDGGVGVIEGLNVGASDTFDIAAGQNHAVVLKNDGTLWAWGDGSRAQLGNAFALGEYSPVQVSGLSNVVSVNSGNSHSLAVKSDGTVWAWGLNDQGQLGDNTLVDKGTPVQVSGLTNVTGISGGGNHSLALKSDGTVWAWGRNDVGQLGDGTTTRRLTPVRVSGLTNMIAVSTRSAAHSIALKNDGTVWAWGLNTQGQLGDGTTTQRTTPVQVSGLTNITAIACSSAHALALKSDGTVWSWGQNTFGQLGDGTTTNRTTPVQVSGLTDVVKIFSGNNYSFAIKSDGTVWTWGSNTYGRLLDGTTTDRNTPVQVLSSANSLSMVSPGLSHTTVLKDDGTVLGIGDNTYGQLGDGTGVNSSTLVQASVLSNTTSVSCGNDHCLALKNDGTVWAWGRNSSGQLGNGLIANLSHEAPIKITGFDGIAQIVAGGFCTVALKNDGTVWVMGDVGSNGVPALRLSKNFVQIPELTNIVSVFGGGTSASFHALKSDGTAWAWGYNGWGQLGDGTTTLQRATPVQSIIQNVKKIAPSNPSQHTIFLKNDGTVWTVGINSSGQLGDGTLVAKSTPLQVSGLTNVIDVIGIQDSSYAIKSDGTVWAWGRNSLGYLADGTTTNRTTPVQATSLTDVAAIYGGGNGASVFVVKNDGTVWAWGTNNNGQLGDGTTTNRSTPVKLTHSYIKDVKKIVASNTSINQHACYLLTQKGSVLSWGNNANGKLGTGDTQNRSYPGLVSGYNGVKMMAAGGNHTLALRKNGTVWSWGLNTYGQLGDDRVTTSTFAEPYKINSLSDVEKLQAGTWHSIAIKSDGTLWVWGRNHYGQLGDGTSADKNTPTQVAGVSGAISAAGGHGHTLFAKSDGTVWAWGFNAYGQLGDGTTNNTTTPVQVSGLTNVIAVASGEHHSLALKSDGTVWAWGLGTSGQVGDGTANRSSPVQVAGLTNVIAIYGGALHSLALKSDGTVWAWGLNTSGQLGNNSTTNRSEPVQVSSLTNVTKLFAGNTHNIALKSDGTVWAWGANTFGEIGNSELARNFTTPVQVPNLGPDIVDVYSGNNSLSSFAVDSSGILFAWGFNTSHELGVSQSSIYGTPHSADSRGWSLWTPTRSNLGVACFSALEKVTGKIALTTSNAAAIKPDGTVWTWGLNNLGQLGNGTVTDNFTNAESRIPIQVPGFTNAKQISGGNTFFLALKNDGTVWGWGSNTNGQLGDGTTTQRNTPVQVSGLSNVISISTGSAYSLALKSDGTVWAWGLNTNGQLGDGTTTQRTTPVQVSGLTNVIQIFASSSSSRALKSDGTVWTWGFNGNRELGTGFAGGSTAGNQTSPVRVTGYVQTSGLTDIIDLSEGNGLSSHCLSIKNDGTVWSWGLNINGQLGRNDYNSAASWNRAVQVVGVSSARDVFLGGQASYIIEADGTVWMYGRGFRGATGLGWTYDDRIALTSSALTATKIISLNKLDGIVNIASNNNMMLVQKNDGSIISVGSTIGPTTQSNLNIPSGLPSGDVRTAISVPLQIPNSQNSSKVSIGQDFVLILRNDGTVWGIGNNGSGQLANGNCYLQSELVKASGLTDITQIHAGLQHSVALKSDGTVWTWGRNTYGQLGDRGAIYADGTNLDNLPRNIPAQVSGLGDVAAVSSGQDHVVALKNDGTVWTWGLNDLGQLGHSNTAYSTIPTQVSNLANVIAVAAGRRHTLAVKNDGTVWAWGWNTYGQLGNSTNTNSSVPVQVTGMSGATAVAAGDSHSIVLKSDGTVWAWGLNSYGQLGDSSNTNRNSPVRCGTLTGITSISGGVFHTIARKSDGTVWAWGINPSGQLGDGTTTNKNTPTQVRYIAGTSNLVSNALTAAAGVYNSAMVHNDGTVWIFGKNNFGQFGQTAPFFGVNLDTPQTYRKGNILEVKNNGVTKLTIDSKGSIIPASDDAQTLGASNKAFGGVYSSEFHSPNLRLHFITNASYSQNSYVSWSGGTLNASSIAHKLHTGADFNVAGQKLVTIFNNTTEKAYFDKDGRLVMDPGDSTATLGNATVNKPSGRCSIPSGSSSVTITNSLVSSTSIIIATLLDADGNNFIKCVTPTSGAFTIKLKESAGSNIKVGWVIH